MESDWENVGSGHAVVTLPARQLAGAVSPDPTLKEIDMDDSARSVTSWQCRLGRHTWLVVNDDNPEQRQNTHLECSRCSKIKEQTQFEHTKATWLSSGPG